MRSDDTSRASLGTSADERLLELDPLLPELPDLAPGCGATFAARDDNGKLTAIGCCEHWAGEPDSVALLWGTARQYRFTPRLARDAGPAALDLLLTQWHAHLAAAGHVEDDDSAAIITWPSRDIEGIRVLLEHGLVPSAVIAARRTGPADGDTAAPAGPGTTPPAAPAPKDVLVRRAGPADLDVVTSLGVGLVRYDSRFGAAIDRPHVVPALREGSAELLARPEPWVWLAERAGTAVGLLAAEPPDIAQWIAPLTRLSPVAYLQQGFVLPGERATGIGALLTAEFHAQARRAGVPITMLHYSQVNPLSAPFWSQRGYRPLWTAWQARPAQTLR